MQLRAITMMPKKAQKHHYQTSRKAQYASLAIAVLVFAALMAYYIVVRNQPANIAFINRAFGPYWWAYACMMLCNVISCQVKKSRATKRLSTSYVQGGGDKIGFFFNLLYFI